MQWKRNTIVEDAAGRDAIIRYGSEILIFGCRLDIKPKALPSTSKISKHRIIYAVKKLWDPSFSDNQLVRRIRSQKRYEFLFNSVVWWILPARTWVETIFSARIYDASRHLRPAHCSANLNWESRTIPYCSSSTASALRLHLCSNLKSLFFTKFLNIAPWKILWEKYLFSFFLLLHCFVYLSGPPILEIWIYFGNA